ncbi:MAG: efflux RND transporter permease subunit, partial [Pseudomonadota bacterium]
VDIEYGGADGFAGGFSLRLLGPDGLTLRAAEAELMAAISQYAGVYGVRSGLEGGQSELSINLRPDAIGLGITPEQLARQIGTNYGGAEVQRILRDGQDIEVRLHVEDAARDEIGDILDARIRSDQGMWLRVAAVTEIEGTYTPSAIARFNGDLVSTVSAVIDSDIVTRGEIVSVIKEEVMPGILAKYPGVALAPGGALEEQENIEDKLIGAGLLSILAIYALLAIPLKSYFQPFLIFAVLPFGAIGAVLGHVLLGLPVSVFSFFGMLALAGVMVNDSLVLISRYHALRAQGAEIADSIVEASLTRFQAIFLTTATTVIGLAPLMTEISEQAQILIPAAVSIAFGLISATLITLILLPVLLMIYAQDLVEPRAGARRSVPSGA